MDKNGLLKMSLFSVVRDPYERCISEWKYRVCQSGPNHFISNRINGALKRNRFFEYCHYLPQTEYIFPNTPITFQIIDNLNNSKNSSFLLKKIEVENYEIIRFENFTSMNTLKIFEKYGIPINPFRLPFRERTEESKLCREKYGNYKSSELVSLLSNSTRSLIKQFFKKDFEVLGY